MITSRNAITLLTTIDFLTATIAAAQGPAVELLREDFEQQPLDRWEFSCHTSFHAEAGSTFVRTSGAGHALWVVPRQDFLLKFRYRSPAGGLGDVIFRGSEQPYPQMYSLRMEPTHVFLCIRTEPTRGNWQERELAQAPFVFKPGQWYNVQLQAVGGKIDVLIDGKHAIGADDPQPLPAGVVGLGVIKDTGAVDYDDAQYVPPGPAIVRSAHPTTTVPSTKPTVTTPSTTTTSPSASQPAIFAGGQVRTENFEQQPLTGWGFSCPKNFINEGGNTVLRVSGAGHALWLHEKTDFLLKFQYRSQSGGGHGDVILRASKKPVSLQYSLRLEPAQIVLCQRRRTAVGTFQEQQLGIQSVSYTPGQWHTIAVRMVGNRVDVAVDGSHVLTAQDPQPLPSGIVGLGVIGGTGSVDYDNAQYGPPGPSFGPSATAPGQTTPQPMPVVPPGTAPTTPGQQVQPMPMPIQPVPGGSQATSADLAVTDIYATKLRQGKLFVRITNRGPSAIYQRPATLTTNLGGALAQRNLVLNLAPGQTQAVDTGQVINTSQGALKVTATIHVPGVPDSLPGNNQYVETVPRASGGPAPPPPGGGSKGDIDIKANSINVDANGDVWVYYTYFGPDTPKLNLQLIAVINGKQWPVHNQWGPQKNGGTGVVGGVGKVRIDRSKGPHHIVATVQMPGTPEVKPDNNRIVRDFPKVP